MDALWDGEPLEVLQDRVDVVMQALVCIMCN